MATDTGNSGNHAVLYEPHENPPLRIAMGLGLQYVMLTISAIIITVAIVVRSAEGSEAYLSWATFGALFVCGVSTMVQARRIGPIGAGQVLLMGTSGAFIAASVTALTKGGPLLLASLVVASSLFQFALSWRLALLRRIITPLVGGVVIMLISVTVMPFLLDLVVGSPEGSHSLAAPMTALSTLVVTMMIVLRARGMMRLWGPVIGILAGCVVGASFGMYDWQRVVEAPWVGLPAGDGWPGFGFSFGADFWGLLPTFVFVTLIGAIETIGDAVAIQRVTRRIPRATDYGAVQGAVAADGLGNFLSGLFGTVPNTTYSSSVSLAEITGVASRRVGICIGSIFCALAFLPKLSAVVLAIPDAVIGSYAFVLIGVLFVIGMRVVAQDGLDYRRAAIVGVSFWAGMGFQDGRLFNEMMPLQLQPIFESGMVSGGLVAIILTALLELTGSRRMKMSFALDVQALPKMRRFLDQFSARQRWPIEMSDRMQQASEETLILLLERTDSEDGEAKRKLRISARKDGADAELEFIAAAGEGNLEDRIAMLSSDVSAEPREHEMSLRLLRHISASVQHQKYRDAEIISLRISGSEAAQSV